MANMYNEGVTYRERLKKALNKPLEAVLRPLNTPQKVQAYLDSLPINFEEKGDTYMSPARMVEAKVAHCAEAALFAAAALAYHGEKPLIMDLRSIGKDVDHVVALFRQNGYWGAISKTNYPVLRYRDPIYPDPKSIALSYFHEYFLDTGQKTLREYSAPFDLSKYDPKEWVTEEKDLYDLIQELDDSRHYSLVPKKNERLIRKATKFEIDTTDAREWKRPKKRRK